MKKNIYTQEFKQGAARMVAEEKSSMSEVTKNLGVSYSALTKWVQSYKKHGTGSFPGKGLLAPQDEEIRKLKLALRRAEMERDLLKKTVIFFAENDKKNLPL